MLVRALARLYTFGFVVVVLVGLGTVLRSWWDIVVIGLGIVACLSLVVATGIGWGYEKSTLDKPDVADSATTRIRTEGE